MRCKESYWDICSCKDGRRTEDGGLIRFSDEATCTCMYCTLLCVLCCADTGVLYRPPPYCRRRGRRFFTYSRFSPVTLHLLLRFFLRPKDPNMQVFYGMLLQTVRVRSKSTNSSNVHGRSCSLLHHSHRAPSGGMNIKHAKRNGTANRVCRSNP